MDGRGRQKVPAKVRGRDDHPAPNPPGPGRGLALMRATRTHPRERDGDPSEAAADSVAEGDGDSADADADDGERRGGGDRVESGVVTNVTRRRGDAIVARCRTRVVLRRRRVRGSRALCVLEIVPLPEKHALLSVGVQQSLRGGERAPRPRGARGGGGLLAPRRVADDDEAPNRPPIVEPPAVASPMSNRRTVCCAEDPGVFARAPAFPARSVAARAVGERPAATVSCRIARAVARQRDAITDPLEARRARDFACDGDRPDRSRGEEPDEPRVRRSAEARVRVRRGARGEPDMVQRVEERFP